MSLSSRAARMILRPMRPNPLMPTLMGMMPPLQFFPGAARPGGPRPKAEHKMLEAAGRKVNALTRVDTRGEIGNLLGELLDFGDVFTHEADKHGLRGRLAVDPILDLVCRLLLEKKKATGIVNGCDHHLAINTDTGAPVLYSLFNLW